jgi:hypothetical protein
MTDLEGPDEWITITRAARISGLAKSTLSHQAVAGKLQSRLSGHNRLTTRRWLHQYLMDASERDKGKRKPLPPGYVAPEQRP